MLCFSINIYYFNILLLKNIIQKKILLENRVFFTIARGYNKINLIVIFMLSTFCANNN